MPDIAPKASASPDARRTRLAGRIAACLAAGLIVGAWLLIRADVRLPRSVGFRLGMAILLSCTAVWWALADRYFAVRLRRAGVRRAVRLGLAVLTIALCLPVVYMLVADRADALITPPTAYVAAVQVWHMFMALAVPAALALWLVTRPLVWGARWLLRPRPPEETIPESANATPPAAPSKADFSRRQVLTAAGVWAPIVIVGGATGWSGRQTGRFEVRRYDLPAPWLPPRLRGLTISHVSDWHLGRFYRPWMLPRLVDETNALRSDLIVVTGDIVDMSNDMLPPAANALRQLESPRGMWLCLGNHDLIDDGAVFAATLRDGGFGLLVDERRTLTIDGERITLAGLDWAGGRRRRGESADSVGTAGHGGGPRGHREHIATMLDGYERRRDGPLIALAHHPHAFDDLSDAGAELTLSGHTHGGQLMFRPPAASGLGGAEYDVGIGPLLFRYNRGFYHRGRGTLFVNSGVGNWFPIRTHAPAEIVQIRLV